MKKKMKQSQISLFCITKQATASEHEMRHNMFKLKSVAEHAGFATHFEEPCAGPSLCIFLAADAELQWGLQVLGLRLLWCFPSKCRSSSLILEHSHSIKQKQSTLAEKIS